MRVLRLSVTSLLFALSLVAVACGSLSPTTSASPTAGDRPGSQQTSTAVSTSPATAPGATAATTPAATATTPGSVISPTPAASSTPAGTVTQGGTQPIATNGVLQYQIVPDGTEARFRVREQLAERSFPSDAVGTTRAVSGKIVLDANGKILSDQSKFVVDLATLQSDRPQRDRFIQRSTLQTAQYPTAEFIPTEIHGLPSPLPTSGKVAFQLVGEMAVHGVTRPVTWDVTGQVEGKDITGQATTSFTFEDFGMSRPRVAVVLSVEDNIRLEVDFHLVRSA